MDKKPMEETLYEIEETRYRPRLTTRLDFKGSLKETKESAEELARQNTGIRYAVFRANGFLAGHQAYWHTTITCPKCAEVIPVE